MSRPRMGPCMAKTHEPTPRSYRKGCRCPETRAAWNVYQVDYKARRARGEVKRPSLASPEAVEERRIYAIGVRRRLRAMMRIGHGLPEIARETKLSVDRLKELVSDNNRSGKGAWRSTHERINAVYGRFQYEPGPDVGAAVIARSRGYLPPAAWAPEDLDRPEAIATWPYRQKQEEAS